MARKSRWFCLLFISTIGIAYFVKADPPARRRMPARPVSVGADKSDILDRVRALGVDGEINLGNTARALSTYYTTGFETSDGFTTGWINGQTGGTAPTQWGVSSAAISTVEGKISNANFNATGGQHLRLAHDPLAPQDQGALGVDARVPSNANIQPVAVAPVWISMDIAISAFFGANFHVQPQAVAEGMRTAKVAFYTMYGFNGFIYIQDAAGGFYYGSPWYYDYTAAYYGYGGYFRNLTIDIDPCLNFRCDSFSEFPGQACTTDRDCRGGRCAGKIIYSYGGSVIYTGTVWAGTTVDQLLWFSDNLPETGQFPVTADIDNVIYSVGTPCAPTGACCTPICTGGDFPGSPCIGDQDCQVGGTCFWGCYDGLNQNECEVQLGGMYNGDGTTCANTQCFCCFGGGECQPSVTAQCPPGSAVDACAFDFPDSACPPVETCCFAFEGCGFVDLGTCGEFLPSGIFGSDCLGDSHGNGIDDVCDLCISDSDCDDGQPCTDDICDVSQQGQPAFCINPVSPPGTVCRPAVSDCDAPESCDGVNPDCPLPDGCIPPGTNCNVLPIGSGQGLCDGVCNCIPFTGACCIDGICQEGFTQGDCQLLGGSYNGDFTTCLETQCACCWGEQCDGNTATNICLMDAGNPVDACGGGFPDAACTPFIQACCLPPGFCLPGFPAEDCLLQGGILGPPGSFCDGLDLNLNGIEDACEECVTNEDCGGDLCSDHFCSVLRCDVDGLPCLDDTDCIVPGQCVPQQGLCDIDGLPCLTDLDCNIPGSVCLPQPGFGPAVCMSRPKDPLVNAPCGEPGSGNVCNAAGECGGIPPADEEAVTDETGVGAVGVVVGLGDLSFDALRVGRYRKTNGATSTAKQMVNTGIDNFSRKQTTVDTNSSPNEAKGTSPFKRFSFRRKMIERLQLGTQTIPGDTKTDVMMDAQALLSEKVVGKSVRNYQLAPINAARSSLGAAERLLYAKESTQAKKTATIGFIIASTQPNCAAPDPPGIPCTVGTEAADCPVGGRCGIPCDTKACFTRRKLRQLWEKTAAKNGEPDPTPQQIAKYVGRRRAAYLARKDESEEMQKFMDTATEDLGLRWYAGRKWTASGETKPAIMSTSARAGGSMDVRSDDEADNFGKQPYLAPLGTRFNQVLTYRNEQNKWVWAMALESTPARGRAPGDFTIAFASDIDNDGRPDSPPGGEILVEASVDLAIASAGASQFDMHLYQTAADTLFAHDTNVGAFYKVPLEPIGGLPLPGRAVITPQIQDTDISSGGGGYDKYWGAQDVILAGRSEERVVTGRKRIFTKEAEPFNDDVAVAIVLDNSNAVVSKTFGTLAEMRSPFNPISYNIDDSAARAVAFVQGLGNPADTVTFYEIGRNAKTAITSPMAIGSGGFTPEMVPLFAMTRDNLFEMEVTSIRVGTGGIRFFLPESGQALDFRDVEESSLRIGAVGRVQLTTDPQRMYYMSGISVRSAAPAPFMQVEYEQVFFREPVGNDPNTTEAVAFLGDWSAASGYKMAGTNEDLSFKKVASNPPRYVSFKSFEDLDGDSVKGEAFTITRQVVSNDNFYNVELWSSLSARSDGAARGGIVPMPISFSPKEGNIIDVNGDSKLDLKVEGTVGGARVISQFVCFINEYDPGLGLPVKASDFKIPNPADPFHSCPVTVESPLLAAPPHDILKNRYISIDRGNVGLINFDIQVTLTSTQVNGVTAVGQSWWANAPDPNCISIAGPTRPLPTPDWSGCQTVHLTGCPILPTSIYDIAIVDGAEVSVPLVAQTQAKPGVKWFGDVVGTFNLNLGWSAPNGVVSIDDANAGIKTFQNPGATPGCPVPPCNATHTSVTDIEPNRPDLLPPGNQINKVVNIADVLSIIIGFQGLEYPGGQIELCLCEAPTCP